MSAVSWKVKLEGRRDNLLALSQCFRSPTCRITEEEGAFYLTSSHWAYPPEPTEEANNYEAADIVRAWAVDLVALVNGAAYLQFRCYEEVQLGDVLGVYEDGRGYITLCRGGGKSERIWTEGPSASPNPNRWVECADLYPNVAEALAIYGRDTAELTRERAARFYNVLEVIRDDVKDLETKYWVSWSDYKLCKHSLNQYRHARPTGTPPKKPMPLAACHTLVRALLQAWIEEKLSTVDPVADQD